MAYTLRQKFSNLAFFILNVVITYGSMTGIFGPTNSDISKKYPTLITPAGYAFSIWGIIFLLEAVWTVLQFLNRFADSKYFNQVVPVSWAATCVFQSLWTVIFAREQLALSLACIIGIWLSLLVTIVSQCCSGCCRRSETASANVDLIPLKKPEQTSTVLEYFLLSFPFQLHFAWVTAATVVLANLVLVANTEDPSCLVSGAIVGLAVLAIVAGVARSNPVVPAVFAWAVGAVASELKNPEQRIVDTFHPEVYDGVRKAATVLAIVFAVIAVVRTLKAACRARCSKKASCEYVQAR